LLPVEGLSYVGIHGLKQVRDQLIAVIRRLDKPPEKADTHGQIRVLPVHFVEAMKVAKSIEQVMATFGTVKDAIKVVADESTNSLIITADRPSHVRIASLLKKLDVKRQQLFLDVHIVQISVGGGFEFGSSVLFGAQGDNVKMITGWQGQNAAPLLLGAQSQQQSETLGAAMSVTGGFADAASVGVIGGDGIDVAGVGRLSPAGFLKFLETDDSSRLLSQPYLMAVDQTEASLVIGRSLYFANKSTTVGVSARYEKEDVGLELRIKPSISKQGAITLECQLDDRSVMRLDPSSGLPLISQRKSKQVIIVDDGKTAVISGVKTVMRADTSKRIPFLGDLPGVGFLFRTLRTQEEEVNLAVLITPHIVESAQDLERRMQSKVEEKTKELMKKSKTLTKVMAAKAELTNESNF
jgi:general secretion pathway protein D